MERLSLDEAAARWGVSVSTLRRRIKRGELSVERERLGSGFKYWVLLEEEAVPEPKPAPDELVAALAERDWLRARVEELTTLLNREQETSLRLSLALGQRPAIASAVDTPPPTQGDQAGPGTAAEAAETPATPSRPRRWWRRLLGR